MNTYRQPGNYVQVEPGVDIYYEERGTGTPIVFVPGWTFTTEMFVHQMEHFSKTHRVIAIDPRSQGRSSIALHGNDYTTHAADLGKIIDALDLQDIVLVGWSFGCLAEWGYVKQKGTEALKAMVCMTYRPSPCL
jgi:pimeloyl-ACP methyl ester carboxylesterase